MKSALLIVTFVAFQCVSAQDVSGLPSCGQYCVNQAAANALAIAQCNVGHANCYCSRTDFLNQVKTCLTAQCTNATDASITNAFAAGFCGDNSGGANTGTIGSTTASASKTSSSSSTSSSATAAAQGHSDTASASSSGLSTGAKAGVGVGVGLGVPILALLAFLAFRKRPRKDTAEEGKYSDSNPPPRYEAGMADGTAEKKEAMELHGDPVIHEMPATRVSDDNQTISMPPTVTADSPAVSSVAAVSPEQHTVNPTTITDGAAR